MRNKCKHKKHLQLIDLRLMGIKCLWCPNCGATRVDRMPLHPYGLGLILQAPKGKWKSPKIAIK